jgi:hypothetical protein
MLQRRHPRVSPRKKSLGNSPHNSRRIVNRADRQGSNRVFSAAENPYMKLNPAQTAVKHLNQDIALMKASKANEAKALKSISAQEQQAIDSFSASPDLAHGLSALATVFKLGMKEVQVKDSYGQRISAERKAGIGELKKAEPALTFKKLNQDRQALGLKALKAPPPSMTHKGAEAVKIAHSVLGHNISQLKHSGPLAKYLDKWPGNNVCCANFVSACLQKAGLIKNSEHSDNVRGLASKLGHDKNWSHVSSHNMKVGDVVCFDVPGEGHFAHVEMFNGYVNGRPTFIGSNNVNSDGTQRISIGHAGYAIDAVYRHKG